MAVSLSSVRRRWSAKGEASIKKTNKGHVAGVCWYIFSIKRFDPFDGLHIKSFKIDNPIHMIQAENYTKLEGQVRLDNAGLPYEGNAIHIAGDSGDNGDTCRRYRKPP